MGEKKSKADNRKVGTKKSVPYDVNDQVKENSSYDINKPNENLNEGSATQQPLYDATDEPNNLDIKALADKVTNINILRFELERLQLDFQARAYFENDVKPLIDTLYSLSHASINYSTSASNFASTNFGHSSKIKDALDLAEEVNDISEELIEVLRCKINNMLKFSKYDI